MVMESTSAHGSGGASRPASETMVTSHPALSSLLRAAAPASSSSRHSLPGDTPEQTARSIAVISSPLPHEQYVPNSIFFQYPLSPGPCPPGRWAHSAVGVGNVMVVYGGVGHSVLDDLCVLDAETLCWRATTTYAAKSKDRPEKMLGHAAAAVGHTVWIFGGQQGRKFLRTLYSLDVDKLTWQRHSSDQLPAARAGHAMASVGSTAYLFGGQGKRLYNDLHQLLPDSGQFVEVAARGTPPTPRRGHSFVYDGRDALVCFGGTTANTIDNNLHVFSLSRLEWTVPACSGSCPSARSQHSAVLLSPGVILFFGGCNAQGTFFGDAFLLDTRTFTWHKPNILNTPPAPRYHHSCCSINGKVLLYGGINAKQTFDGVVLVESKFNTDISHIAEELSKMTAGVGSTGGASGPATPGPRNSSEQGPAAMDLMKLHLTDLLVKRNMEEIKVQATKKAEASEVLLQQQRETNEKLARDVTQLKLLLAETEDESQLWQQRFNEAQAKMQRDSTALSDLRSTVETLQQQLAAKETEVQECRALQDSLVKELGIISSRYCRLKNEHEARSSSQSSRRPLAGEGSVAGSSSRWHRGRSMPEEIENYCGSLATLPQASTTSGPPGSSHASSHQIILPVEHALLHSNVSNITGMNEARSETSSTPYVRASSPAATASAHTSNTYSSTSSSSLQLLSLLSRSELQRATLLDENHALQEQVQRLQEELVEVNEKHQSAARQSAQERERLAKLEAQVNGHDEALQPLNLHELQDLEARLDRAARRVRDIVLTRTIAEVQRKASSEHAMCNVCMERPRDVAFNCGHQCCEPCAAKMSACPYCRNPITARIKLFNA